MESINKDLSELKIPYRIRIDCISIQKSFVSNKTFDTYDEAWTYGVTESKKFQPCSFCVIRS